MSQHLANGNSLNAAAPCIAISLILITYSIVSVNHLAVFPPMGQDEPWIAAAPYKLVTQGVYGSDLFAGYYGMDQHNFDHMPVYPLLQAAVFKVFGVGTFQMRILPVSLGFVLLLLVIAVGYQLSSPRVGILGATLLVGLRAAAGDDATGILLLDQARINRYDIAVPVFGLMALLAFNRAERTNSRLWFTMTGLFTGLSSLSHLYGLFWLPAFVIVLIYRHRQRLFRQVAPFFMLAGFAISWLPWIVYIAGNWNDYLNQNRAVANRFAIFQLSFYISNVIREIDRYRPLGIFNPSDGLRWARPGTWTAVLGVPAALGVMLLRTRHRAHDAAFTLATATIVQVGLFTLLLKLKTYGYLIALWPLATLALAWLGLWLWEQNPITKRVRVVLLALLAVILAEGAVRVTHTWMVAARTNSYDEFTKKVAGCIPSNSLVLGLQHYWLGLRQYRYRSWLLPMNFSNPSYYHAPMTIQEALERVGPDVVLIDRSMQEYFQSVSSTEHPEHNLYEGFQSFMAHHNAEITCVEENETYGTMRIFLLKGSLPPRR